MTKLGRLAEFDRSTIGRNVRALEKLRLVLLGRAKDQREAAVRLTGAGMEALQRAAPYGRRRNTGSRQRWARRGCAVADACLQFLIFFQFAGRYP